MKPILLAASVQGASHIRTGTECQDSYKKVACENGTVIMAVADGHGSKSCPYSKTGAQIAVNSFCSVMEAYIKNYADNPDMLMTYLNREGDTKVAQEIDVEWKRRVNKAHTDNKRAVTRDAAGIKIKEEIYKLYGTTLLGLVLTDNFLFALQIGDGDIVYISKKCNESVVQGDKILGVETHSLSKLGAWEKAITVVRRIEFDNDLPALFLMATDGFSNSYKNSDEFFKSCYGYFSMLNQYGVKAVKSNLKEWLNETSSMGCGDDITLCMAYYPLESANEICKTAKAESEGGVDESEK